MEEPVFADKAHEPTDRDLATALGRAKRHWDALVTQVQKVSPDATAAWKHYAGKYGWTFVVREKRRNLLYLKPAEKRFTASLALGEDAVAALRQSGLPDALVQTIEQSPKYPEGRPARIDVASAADLKIATKLVAVKLGH